MQRSQNSRGPVDKRSHWNWTAGILAAYGLVGLVLAALTASHIPVSEWISEAAEAEFVGSVAPSAAPTQHAAPAEQVRVVRRN